VKKSQLRELSVEELKVRLEDDLVALENLRFQKALQQLENPLKIKQVRREIAQIKTVLKEYQLGLRSTQSKAS
jgi:large subunit ribosomal protein L29